VARGVDLARLNPSAREASPTVILGCPRWLFSAVHSGECPKSLENVILHLKTEKLYVKTQK
jgi:hypothetical protein